MCVTQTALIGSLSRESTVIIYAMNKGILLIVEDEADLSEILVEMLAPL